MTGTPSSGNSHCHINDLSLGAPQKQFQVPQASSEPVVPWTDNQKLVITPVTPPVSPVTPELLNTPSPDLNPSAPPAAESLVNPSSGAANASAADLTQVANTSTLPSNPGSQSTSPILCQSSWSLKILRRVISEI